jgi:hypothetical protein
MSGFFKWFGLDHGAHRLGSVMFCSLILLIACPSAYRKDEKVPPYLEVLSDFVFVGSGAYAPSSIPAHGTKEIVLPTQLKVGTQYIFHLRRSEQTSDIHKTLVERLQSRGIKVVSSDVNLDKYIGGPIFRISFQGDDFKGFIFNALDGQIVKNEALSREWSVDDYILVLEEL